MSGPTEADREKATEVVELITGAPWDVFSDAEWSWVDRIAAALAAERDAALAPVLALADQIDEDADAADQLAQGWLDVGSHADRDRCLALADDRREIADRIRAAVAPSPATTTKEDGCASL